MPDTTPSSQEPLAAPAHPVRDAVAHLQDRIAAGFGISPADREATVVSMLGHSGDASAGYWLQLLLAMGIASLGLSLSSTAVVIGAMLISPLMSPIVAFGMGLAVGSPVLVLRSLTRTAASVAVVVLCSSLLMLALPFAEVTPEIAARTAPTALDLLVAVFCALAAAYTTVRAGSDTTATAAGTAIGIALVPPLCVIGYGIGTGSRTIASGAALLFTANFCAILLFAVLSFLLLGYSAVRVSALEQAELSQHGRGVIPALARGLRFLFGLRYGALLRVLMPVILLAAVFVPLREALSRVTWQVRVRASIQSILAELPQSTVRSSVSVEGGGVSVRLLTIGRAEDAAKLEGELRERIAAAAGVVPQVDVTAVPDATALEQVAAIAKTARPPVEAAHKEPDLSLLREALSGTLARVWPAEAGALLRFRVELPEDEAPIVEVVHLGAPLGAAGATLLAQDLGREIGAKLAVRDVAIDAGAVTAEPEGGIAWLGRAVALAVQIEAEDGLRLCVEVPAPPKGRPVSKDAEAVVAAIHALPAARAGRVEFREGKQGYRAIATANACPDPGGADAGAPHEPGDAGPAGDAGGDGGP